MNKKTIAIVLIIAISLASNAYFFGTQFYNKKKTEWLNYGALQMREAVFNTVQKGETQIANASGDIITIIKK